MRAQAEKIEQNLEAAAEEENPSVNEVELTPEEEAERQQQVEEAQKLSSKLLAGLAQPEQPAAKKKKKKAAPKSKAADGDSTTATQGAGTSGALLDDVDMASEAGSKSSKAGGKFANLDEEMKAVAILHFAEREKQGIRGPVSCKSLQALKLSSFFVANTDHEQGHALAGVGCSKKRKRGKHWVIWPLGAYGLLNCLLVLLTLTNH